MSKIDCKINWKSLYYGTFFDCEKYQSAKQSFLVKTFSFDVQTEIQVFNGL